MRVVVVRQRDEARAGVPPEEVPVHLLGEVDAVGVEVVVVRNSYTRP